MPKRIISLLSLAALVAAVLFPPSPSRAGKLPSIIRDAEIETTIRQYTTPIFKAAGLNANAVHVYLLQSDEINSFVAGGMNIFLYTGLLVRTQRPGQLIAVLAHETGHIAGGHLARIQQELNNQNIVDIISMVLVGPVSILKYTRTMEASADAAALTFLDRAHQSARGMAEFLNLLKQQEQVLFGHLNPYLINHPLTTDRIATVQQHIAQSPYSDVPDPPAWVEEHKRMIAKLIGFLRPLPDVLQLYPETDNSLYGRYARAIAYFRVGELQRSLALIDGLIAEHPTDPYFEEQKGQILFENGHGAEALVNYQKALALAPDQALIRMELANVQIEQNDPSLLGPAIAEMKQVILAEPHDADAWRLLGIAYGRNDQIGLASWALAESAAEAGRAKEARDRAKQALQQLPYGSPEWLRSQDIMDTIKPHHDGEDNGGGGGISG